MELSKKEALAQQVSILRGLVNFIDRINLPWINNEIVIQSVDAEASEFYRAGQEMCRRDREIYCEELRRVVSLMEAEIEGKTIVIDFDTGHLKHILRCLMRYHKITYYGKDCFPECTNRVYDLDGIPCEICEMRKSSKEIIENDLYLGALREALRLVSRYEAGKKA